MSSTSYKTVPASPQRGGQRPDSYPDQSSKAPAKHHRFPFLHTKKGIIITLLVVLVIIGGGLAGLAALPKHRDGQESGGDSTGDGSGGNGDVITDDSHFYGESPGVYPSRKCLACHRMF